MLLGPRSCYGMRFRFVCSFSGELRFPYFSFRFRTSFRRVPVGTASSLALSVSVPATGARHYLYFAVRERIVDRIVFYKCLDKYDTSRSRIRRRRPSPLSFLRIPCPTFAFCLRSTRPCRLRSCIPHTVEGGDSFGFSSRFV